MQIRNRTFFIAENVSGHYRCRFAREILQRGGILSPDPHDTDYVIFDAEKDHPARQEEPEEHPVFRITVNEAVRFFDSSALRERPEFCVRDGVLTSWIPQESDDQIIVIPEGVRRIKSGAFHPFYPEQSAVFRQARMRIEKIVFPKTLEVIEDDAFKGFKSLRAVRFNSQLKTVSGFHGCSKLADAILPDSIEKIGDYAFSGCALLTDFHFSEKIASIGTHAFERTGIGSFVSGQNLKSVGAYAFSGCERLKKVTLNSPEIVCEKAAFRNSGVKELEIISETCTLKSGCFSGCSDLVTVRADSGKVLITSTVFPYITAYYGLLRIQKNSCTETEADMWKSMLKRYGKPFLKGMNETQYILLGTYAEDLIKEIAKENNEIVIDEPDPIKREALLRIELLIRETGLNPAVRKYYKQGKIYYSYMTADGFMGSIDTISYDPRYEKLAHDTEKQYGIHVYHAVESSYPWPSLILLYVERDPEEWEYFRPDHGQMMVYVHNFETDEGEFGYAGFESYQGALYRTA